MDSENRVGAGPWFALRVRSKHEQVTSRYLHNLGYDHFAPTYKASTQWSDRKKTADHFLFPGYVFCRMNPTNRLPVLTTPGVVDVVGFGGGPTSIPDQEIEQVRAMVRSGQLVRPWPYLEVGQVVRLQHGPLAGLDGILVEVKGTIRLVVSIRLLQRSVATEVDRDWASPLKRSLSSRAASPLFMGR